MGMKISSRDILIGIKEYLLMTFGMFCYAFGWQMCVLPAGGMGGGAAGLATLINAVLPGSISSFLTIGTLVFIINVIFIFPFSLSINHTFNIFVKLFIFTVFFVISMKEFRKLSC